MSSYDKNDPDTIKLMFGSIAQHYDRTNAILSLKLHQYWNSSLVRQVLTSTKPSTFLDLCCGTGDIAYSYLSKTSAKTKAYMLDFCEEMLVLAKEKSEKMGLHHHHDLVFLQADAQNIPLKTSSVDCATISYGIRNIKTPSQCIKEAFRVLKPGGVFGILELTRPKNSLLHFFHKIYLTNILPLVGKFCTPNQKAYQYLCNSIHSFISPEELIKMMKEAGFQEIKSHSHLGGIATILLGKKSSD